MNICYNAIGLANRIAKRLYERIGHFDMNNPTSETNPKDVFWGIKTKSWTILAWTVIIGIIVVFIVLPFLISLLLPLVNANYGKDFEYLVDMLDGVSIVLALVGTLASGLSIAMTLVDKKRYAEEKEHTIALMNSVNALHTEVGIVDGYVKKTFEQNQLLRLELYSSKNAQYNPTGDLGVSVNPSKAPEAAWEKQTRSGEVEND